jgi:hypothetical protein
MLKRTIILATVLAAAAGSAMASDDDRDDRRVSRAYCTASPATWLPVDQLTQKLKEKGYTVRELEVSHGCYEVEAIDANGVRVAFYVDPATGEVVNRARRS